MENEQRIMNWLCAFFLACFPLSPGIVLGSGLKRQPICPQSRGQLVRETEHQCDAWVSPRLSLPFFLSSLDMVEDGFPSSKIYTHKEKHGHILSPTITRSIHSSRCALSSHRRDAQLPETSVIKGFPPCEASLECSRPAMPNVNSQILSDRALDDSK